MAKSSEDDGSHSYGPARISGRATAVLGNSSVRIDKATFLTCDVPAILSQIPQFLKTLPSGAEVPPDNCEEPRTYDLDTSIRDRDSVSNEDGRQAALHPLTALGLAGNVLQIVHFTRSLASQLKQIQSSGDLEFANNLQSQVGDLKRQVLRVKATAEARDVAGSDEHRKVKSSHAGMDCYRGCDIDFVRHSYSSASNA